MEIEVSAFGNFSTDIESTDCNQVNINVFTFRRSRPSVPHGANFYLLGSNCEEQSCDQRVTVERFLCCCTQFAEYPDHAECLATVNKDLDCFGVYPQIISLALFWTFRMNLSPDMLYEVDIVVQKEHMLFYSLSRHL